MRLYWVLTQFFVLAFRRRIEGRQHVPDDGAAILACNHVSHLDWLFLPHHPDPAHQLPRQGTGLRGRVKRFFFTASGQVAGAL